MHLRTGISHLSGMQVLLEAAMVHSGWKDDLTHFTLPQHVQDMFR
jgi:hypothetical protein